MMAWLYVLLLLTDCVSTFALSDNCLVSNDNHVICEGADLTGVSPAEFTDSIMSLTPTVNVIKKGITLCQVSLCTQSLRVQ